VPLGAFLVVHLVANARVLRGDAAFERSTSLLAHIPALGLVELLVVYAPLALHAGIGLWLLASRRSIAVPSPYPPALRGWVRATALVALAFLALHLPDLRGRFLGSPPSGAAVATMLAEELSTTWHGVPWRGALYLLGSASVTFHFAAGLWGAFATTRRGADPRTRRAGAWGAVVLGACMWLLFADVVVFHATGVRLFGPGPVEPTSAEPCPAPSASGPP
jgi:succinate dehydrogenase / fumarate reductase, cytochrome b subunit